MNPGEINHTVGSILIVDDEIELMSALCEMLSAQGFKTAGFLTGAEALEVLREREFDLLLTDLMMPKMNGIELIRSGLAIDPNLIGIIMTGHGTVQTAVEAMKTGAFDYVLKPFKLAALMPLLSRAMQVRNLRLENMQLKETVAIHELGKAIAFSSDVNTILNKVADAALQQCSADEVSIMLPTRDGRDLYVAVVRGGNAECVGSQSPIEQGIAGWVARNREPVVLRGEVKDPRMAPIKPRADIHTAVSMPMLSGGNMLGVLNVNITKSHRSFTLGQVKALSILMNIIAPILENTLLYIQIREGEEKYHSIFENAIEGIYQQTPDGRFISANPAFARILGYDSPEELMASVTDCSHEVYADPERAAELSRILKDQGEVRGFEYRACRRDGRKVHLSANVHSTHDRKSGLTLLEGTVEDITERVQSEARLKLTKEILDTLNRTNDVQKLINDILHLLNGHIDIEAVGIRLKEGEDYPYYIANGFPIPFLEAEKFLCVRDDTGATLHDAQGNPILECMCGNVLCGRTDPSLPFFTEGGSFWTNSTTELLASTSEGERQERMRNRCTGEGFESVALIPLRSGSEIIGLLQLNDRHKHLFTLERIHFFEGIAASIGIAVARRRAVESLRKSEEKYRLHFENVQDVIYSIDEELKLLDISPSVEKVLGYRPEELIGRPIYELILSVAKDIEEVSSVLRSVLGGESALLRVCEFVAKDGTSGFYEISTSPVLQDGKIVKIICVARNITERKQAEEWLLRERSMVDRIMKTSPSGIMVMDRNGGIVFANQRAQEILCLTGDPGSGLTYHAPEWRITDFDGNLVSQKHMPFMQVISSRIPVYGVRHRFTYPDNGRCMYLSISAAPLFGENGGVSEVVLSFNDITEHRRAEEKVIETIDKLRRGIEDTIRAMAMIVETRDPYTAGHQGRVAKLAVAIATDMELSEDQINGIRMAGMIHDIGKMNVPAEILSKPTKLSALEFNLIKSHAEVGCEILKTIEFPYPVAEIAHQHHERIDGSGYPLGLKGDEILIEARILALADVVEAMASHRPYRPSLGIDAALAEIKENKGTLYDTSVVDACLRLFREESFQFQS